MELSRSERALNKPINWGERTFKATLSASTLPRAITSNQIQSLLRVYPVLEGTLTIPVAVLNTLKDDEIASYFAQLPHLKYLDLENYQNISFRMVRSVSLACSKSLREVNLSRTSVDRSHLEVLLVRAEALSVLKLVRLTLIFFKSQLSLCDWRVQYHRRATAPMSTLFAVESSLLYYVKRSRLFRCLIAH